MKRPQRSNMIRGPRAEDQDPNLITREIGFARLVADRVAFLAQVRIPKCGTTAQVFGTPLTEACRKFLATMRNYLNPGAFRLLPPLSVCPPSSETFF